MKKKSILNFIECQAGAVGKAQMKLFPGVLHLAKKNETEAEVFIYGDIGGYWDGVSAELFAKELARLDVDTINVRLNSGGGVIWEGIAIYNALVRHKAKVIVHIESIAASIASVIAMAGDEIKIHEGSRLMIHKPWSFAMGTSLDMRSEADLLDALESDIIDIYEARTEQERDNLAEWVGAETWLSAKDAVENGFADEVIPAKKKPKSAATAMMSVYRHAPEDITDQEPTARDIEEMLRANGFSQTKAKRIVASLTSGEANNTGDGQRDADHQPQRDVEGIISMLNRAANILQTTGERL